jgi:transcriptional regulator with XRE-family HTH domain
MSFFPHWSPLRLWRRTGGFKQKEIAKLLGCDSRSLVCRLESGSRLPGFETAVALEVLTGKPLSELFPQAYQEAKEDTLQRVSEQLKQFEGSTRVSSICKRSQLMRVLARTTINPNDSTKHA